MALYCVGDIQGCDTAFEQLLNSICFSPSRDTIYLLGDLVNRGPASDAVLRRCRAHDGAIKALLGNHDLHLLAVSQGIRSTGGRDTLQTILTAHDSSQLIGWLQQQPLAITHTMGNNTMLMVHAGVLPTWSVADTMRYAQEVQNALQGPQSKAFLKAMYGNTPSQWSTSLTGDDRLRCIVNALTRLRFCSPEGTMDFESSEAADQAPAGLVPWFDAPHRQTADTVIAFGHWSTLGRLNRPNLLGLDTGCVWGGCLSTVRLGPTLADREFFQVQCDKAQKPAAKCAL